MGRVGRILLVPLWMGAGAILLWYSLRQLPTERLLQALGQVQLWPLLLALCIDLVSVFFKASKWHTLLRPVEKVGVFRLQGAIYAGGATAMVLPGRLDEAVRAYAAARLSGLTFLQVLGSMVLERLVDVTVLLGFFLLLMAALPLPPVIHKALFLMTLLGGALLAVVLVVHLWSRRRKGGDGPLSTLLARLAEGSRAVARPGLLAAGAAFAVGEWLLTSVVASLAAHSLGLSLPWGARLLVTALIFGSFALPLTPAGIGVFEVACRELLPRLYRQLTVEQAVSLALLIHMLMLAPMALIGTTIIVASGIRFGDVRRWRAQAQAPSSPGGEGQGGGEGG